MAEEVGTLPQELLPQWFDHLDSVFEHTPRSYFERHFYKDASAQLQDIVVAGGPAILSTARFFHRRLLIHNLIVSAAGVGEVSTKLHARRRGLARSVLTTLVSLIKQNGFMLSCLSAAPEAMPLYASLGYHSIPRREVHVDLEVVLTAWPHHTLSASIVCDSSSFLVQEVFDLHATHSARFCGCFARDEEYWRSWWAAEFDVRAPIGALCRSADGSLLGYVCARVNGEGALDVLEIALANDGEASLASVCIALLESVTHKLEKLVRSRHVVLATPLVSLLGEPFTSAIVAHNAKDTIMYKIIDRDALVGALSQSGMGVIDDEDDASLLSRILGDKHVFNSMDSY